MVVVAPGQVGLHTGGTGTGTILMVLRPPRLSARASAGATNAENCGVKCALSLVGMKPPMTCGTGLVLAHQGPYVEEVNLPRGRDLLRL